MSAATNERVITVALVGNPNTGKSTLFNALAGLRQRVGNYPGVTVEKKIGRLAIDDQKFTLVDLPGTYSLAPRSPDEMVAVDVLLGRQSDVQQPDVVLCIVDASNLERNLYLVSQVLELGRPTVIALNMIDVAADNGLTLDVERLRRQLGVPVVKMQANRKVGLSDLKQALSAAASQDSLKPNSPFPIAFQQEVAALESRINRDARASVPRYLVERLLLDTSGYLEHSGVFSGDGELHAEIKSARARLAEAGCPVPAVEAMSRYKWVGEVLDGVVTRPAERRVTTTDRIDKVLTHWLGGTVIFICMMIVVFQAIFAWAVPLMDGVQWLVGQLGSLVASSMPAGALRSLLVDGVIGGVGGVLVFLPQIFILFFFIALLEDCGYMARAAYLMDRLMCRVGLSGKSFIPLLSSFACAIPGIMAARVIENRRDRLVTILVAPLMSCSARLPVYALLIAAFIPSTTYLYGWLGLQGITMFAMYVIGVITAVIVALVLKTTILRGETPPFVMELPTYKVPSLGLVLHRMFDRGWAFVRRAGTIILAVTILIWFASYFPHNADTVEAPYRGQVESLEREIAQLKAATAAEPGDPQADERLAALEAELEAVENEIAGAYLHQSILGRSGRWIEPAVRPLGWDWRIGCAVVASFPAREVVVGTLGVIYNLGDEQDEESEPLRDKLKAAKWDDSGRPVFNVPVALSIMVFFALCAQCASTLVVIRRETGSWGWSAFTFIYMTTIAYLGALATYRIGMFFMS